MLGSIIGGIGSILGGIFGSKKQKQETTVDYVKMASEAEKAGFNPLTALRNGGSAGFTTTVSHPGLSAVGDAIAGVGQSFGAALDKRFDPIEQKRTQVESALMDYQLAAAQDGMKRIKFGDVPARSGGTVLRASVPALGGGNKAAPKDAKANSPGEGTIVGGDDPKVSGLGWNDGKYGVFHAPVLPDGETIETIYGDSEVLSAIYGAGKIVTDGAYSVYRNAKSAEEDYRKEVEKQKKHPTGKPQTAHQADPGSWMDFAPRVPKTSW